MIVLGFDLGLTGAVARLGFREPCVCDLPTTEVGKDKVIDVRALREILRLLVPAHDGQALCVIEDVRVRPTGPGGTGPTVHSTEGKIMRTRGHVEALIWLLGWRLEVVQPQAWKREMGLLKAEKPASRAKAAELFPGLADQLQRVKDHNRADSLLIARYGQMRWA